MKARSNPNRTASIRKQMGGVKVPDDTYELWKAAEANPTKRAEVKAVYMKDMKLDGKDQPVSLWVKPNYELGKQQFFKWNPDYVKKTAKTVKPTAQSEKQHAVNTEGKTDEATKKLKEPLKPGQQQPTETQKNKQDEQKQRPPAQRQTPPAKNQSAGKSKKNSSPKLS